MKKAASPLLGAAALGLLAGCGSGMTQYTPQLRAEGELTLHYDNGFSMTAEGREIASSTTWGGLTEYVKCVPKAKEHAEAAESSGSAAVALSWVGAGIGLGSLGSLAGLSVYDKDPDLAGAILGAGVFAAVTGVVLAAVGRNQKNVANGHAVDAMNYYNDAVGSYGGTCRKPAPALPQVEPERPAKADKPDPNRTDLPDDRATPPADGSPSPPPPPPAPSSPPPDTI